MLPSDNATPQQLVTCYRDQGRQAHRWALELKAENLTKPYISHART